MIALADPDDRDGDGISGRARMIATDGGEGLGRYGWKAQSASLEVQIADAFADRHGAFERAPPVPARRLHCCKSPTA